MKAWSRIPADPYLALDLRAHRLLEGVPLHDVWSVFLPGEERACSMIDVRRLVRSAEASSRTLPVRALFGLRRALGSLFGWDGEHHAASPRLRDQLPQSDVDASLVPPGTEDGPFEVVYVHEREAVSEIENATVRAFLVWAVRPAVGGHQLYWAIYVVPTSAWTPRYMALIDPFRRWIVYPSLLRQLHEAWVGDTLGR